MSSDALVVNRPTPVSSLTRLRYTGHAVDDSPSPTSDSLATSNSILTSLLKVITSHFLELFHYIISLALFITIMVLIIHSGGIEQILERKGKSSFNPASLDSIPPHRIAIPPTSSDSLATSSRSFLPLRWRRSSFFLLHAEERLHKDGLFYSVGTRLRAQNCTGR